ncbi:nucleotide exchange factor GrpE [Anaerocolumna sp. MB42-C2]|uniref:nucleotide exchange factor GrpE n=1 Tax=Anaerocolumna sp. MB42-C2 TaxID=3070997 RepID=UPI0027E0FFA0|nr:nucleotide exchange factor GrpE [Anaerocolumna sp. MB42-C2]WMJ90662.1 nucleotide exchange factor GrpE [Anaerocolumna sp. MB42-C2]
MDEKIEDIVNQEVESESEETVKTDETSDTKAESENVTNTETDSDTCAENMEEEMDEETEEAGGEKKTVKSFFRKDKKDKKDLKIEELNDKLIRTMAEFDNYRKRSEKEKAQMFEIGARDIIEKVLPVIDNFERGLGAITEEEKEGAFAQGIEKIYKQMVTTLTEAGLKPIEAVGKAFDPNFHNAVMHAEDPEQGENLIAEEFQKGYMYRDTVVRHSMVKVVN